MKKLYLVRHAKSSWKDATLPDFERPLNRRGQRDAPFMANLLISHGHLPEVVVCSPAVRTLTTATIMVNAFEKVKPVKIQPLAHLYEAGVAALLQSIHTFDDQVSLVMLVGHNPGLTVLLDTLSATAITDNMPTCAVAGLRFEAQSWQDITPSSGTCFFYQTPKSARQSLAVSEDY